MAEQSDGNGQPQEPMVVHPTMGEMPASVYARIATMEAMRGIMEPEEADDFERQLEIQLGK